MIRRMLSDYYAGAWCLAHGRPIHPTLFVSMVCAATAVTLAALAGLELWSIAHGLWG